MKRSVIVRSHHPRRRIYLIVAILAVAAALAGIYWFGESRGGYLHFRETAALAKANRALADQARANAQLQLRVSFLDHSLKLANESATLVKKNLIAQQSQLNHLQRQIAFYRGIVTPGETGAAVRIAGLQVLPDGSSREYRFQIVLVRGDENSKSPLRGTCSVTVSGERAGKKERLSLGAVSPSTPDPMKFTLRYFTNLSGALRLPVGFIPHHVDVSVEVKGKDKISASYSWPAFRG
ncbi:MAG: DUF6776 family protein [Gammaproteobacteria bacterium]